MGRYCVSITKSSLLSLSGINLNCSQETSQTQKGLLFRILRTEQSRSLYCRFPSTSPPHFPSSPLPCATAGCPQNVSTFYSPSLSFFSTLQGPVGASGAKGDMVNIYKSSWSSLKMTSTVIVFIQHKTSRNTVCFMLLDDVVRQSLMCVFLNYGAKTVLSVHQTKREHIQIKNETGVVRFNQIIQILCCLSRVWQEVMVYQERMENL